MAGKLTFFFLLPYVLAGGGCKSQETTSVHADDEFRI